MCYIAVHYNYNILIALILNNQLYKVKSKKRPKPRNKAQKQRGYHPLHLLIFAPGRHLNSHFDFVESKSWYLVQKGWEYKQAERTEQQILYTIAQRQCGRAEIRHNLYTPTGYLPSLQIIARLLLCASQNHIEDRAR